MDDKEDDEDDGGLSTHPSLFFFSVSSSYFDLACHGHGWGFVSNLELAIEKMKTKTNRGNRKQIVNF